MPDIVAILIYLLFWLLFVMAVGVGCGIGIYLILWCLGCYPPGPGEE